MSALDIPSAEALEREFGGQFTEKNPALSLITQATAWMLEHVRVVKGVRMVPAQELVEGYLRELASEAVKELKDKHKLPRTFVMTWGRLEEQLRESSTPSTEMASCVPVEQALHALGEAVELAVLARTPTT